MIVTDNYNNPSLSLARLTSVSSTGSTRFMNRLLRLLSALALPYIAGLIGSVATTPALSTWYAELVKPSFNPPNWIFGPVWTTLYLLMGIAFYRVWSQAVPHHDTARQRQTILLFMIHLAINAAWPLVFFGLQSPTGGLLVIITLLIVIFSLIRRFFSFDRVAGYLLIPYFSWVLFATLLNAAIWYLN